MVIFSDGAGECCAIGTRESSPAWGTDAVVSVMMSDLKLVRCSSRVIYKPVLPIWCDGLKTTAIEIGSR